MIIDLSPAASLHFTEEKREATHLLKERKPLIFQFEWGKDPFDQPVEAYLLAIQQFTKELFDPFQHAIRSISAYPISPAFFLEPLKASEKVAYEEKKAFRVDLFRRDRLSDFLFPLISPFPIEAPLHLEVEGPLYWLHPTKFPWMKRTKRGGPQGLLFPEIETPQILDTFESLIQGKEGFRLLTEERLPLEWEGLEELWFMEEGLSFQGKRAIKGFEAAGGRLFPFSLKGKMEP